MTDESLRTVEDLRATPTTLQLDVFDVDRALEQDRNGTLRGILSREPQFCICVTGVLNLSEQLAAIAESNSLTLEESRKQFQLIDFELERQERECDSEAGDDLIWKKCDIKVVRYVIQSAREISAEPLPATLRDVVITAPLPSLKEGEYGDAVLHPRLADSSEADENAETPQLLLYRYPDFDVQTGHEYRYRVQLAIIAIPRDPEAPTRWTPWNEPTEWTILMPENRPAATAGSN